MPGFLSVRGKSILVCLWSSFRCS